MRKGPDKMSGPFYLHAFRLPSPINECILIGPGRFSLCHHAHDDVRRGIEGKLRSPQCPDNSSQCPILPIPQAG